MQFSAAQIAEWIQGTIEGNPEVTVQSFGKIEEAKPGDLSFLANPKYEPYLYTTEASILILGKQQVLKQAVAPTLIRVDEPYLAFAKLLQTYEAFIKGNRTGIETPSFIHETASVAENTYIGAFAYLSERVKVGQGSKIHPSVFLGNDVVIGENTTIHAGVRIYHQCRIGNNVIIHANTVIGSDGFGFAPKADGTLEKVPQIGNVVVEDEVEIGAGCTIDRATLGSTRIRKGAKLDNQLQIAHNVEIGEYTVIAAQTGISGSTKIGKGVMIGGQAGIVGHIQIADGTKINAQSGVSKSIRTPNTAVTGSPAYDYTAALRSQAIARNLPEMEKRIQELEAQLRALIQKSQ
jgi:UDP-3-O-[3-hydroxymyristoyl] glucosamine N-acyltransferase